MPNPLPVSLTIVTDCGGSDRGRYENATARCFWPTPFNLAFYSTESKNTLHSGFTGAAHALSSIAEFGPLRVDERVGMIINAAPREGNDNGHCLRGSDRKVEGEQIFALKLNCGVWVVGPNAGYNLYFLQEEVSESYILSDQRGLETPFRSMEFMVPALAKLLEVKDFSDIVATPALLETKIPTNGIYVADWDSHGNIYLFSTIDPEKWLPSMGQCVSLRIGNDVARPRHVDGIFAGHTGEQTLTKGSLKLLGRYPIYYFVVVGSEAHSQIKCPAVGTQVFVE